MRTLGLFALAWTLACAPPPPPAPGTALVIEGGTVIDGRGGAPLPDAEVVIEGNRIAAIGKRGTLRRPAGARILDARGQFVLPGLIDAHVHYHAWQGELHLAHGVTTVKDTGNPVEWLEALSAAIARGEVVGPRLFYSGNSLTSPPPLRDHHIGLESPEMARHAVRILAEHGAKSIKVHQQITEELLRALCEEADRFGLPVTGHLRRIGAWEAIRAGIGGLQHATGIPRSTGDSPGLRKTEPQEDELSGYWDDLYEAAAMHEERFDALIEALIARDVAVIPTLTTWFRVASDRRADYAREDAAYARIEALRYVPDFARAFWASAALYEPRSEYDREQSRLAYKKMSLFLKKFHDAGGRLVLGSSTTLGVAGLALQRELDFFADLGLAPSQVLEIVTRRNAEFLDEAERLGTLAPGKLADVLVVERDPLDDIANLRAIAWVIQGGRVVDTRYHADYAMPIPRPKLTRPVWLEREIEKRQRAAVSAQSGGA